MPDSYTTILSADEEPQYEDWLKKLSEKTGRDMSADAADYDMQGAFKAGLGQSENGHFDDRFKKPNHPTFSSDSQYSGKQFTGGKWEKATAGQWIFKASKDNLKFHPKEELVDYFKRVEPDSTLYVPGESKPAYSPKEKPLLRTGE